MHALRLTTRFKENAYQGEACLLIYDEQRLNGTMLSEDVRDQFESRPSTARIYILAPFVSEIDVRECFAASAVFDRIRNYFHVLGGRLFLLTFRKYEERRVSFAIPFTVCDSGPVEETPEPVEPELRNGWLFDLFDRHTGRLDAPIGVHFGKTSGKHADKFLRVSGVILSSAACAAIAYFTLGSGDNSQPKRIFVDTAPLIAIAFAIQRIATLNNIWELGAPVHSFSSYGGVARLPDPSEKDLILVSASTSGGLVERLRGMGFNDKQVVTIFFLQSTDSSKTAGTIVCDLTFNVGQSFGYPHIENYTAENCPLCKQGFFLAELEGDQFLLEKRAIKKLMVKKASQTSDARATLELLARKNILQVKFFGSQSRHSEFAINGDDMLAQVPEIRARVVRALRRYTPVPLAYVVLVEVGIDTFHALATEAGITSSVSDAKVLDYGDLRNVPPVQNGGVLVLFGHLDDFSKARDINAQLRTVVPKGCVCYISALTIADSAEHLSDLKTFLTYGEEGKDTFTYEAANSLMLPFRRGETSSWDLELQLLQQIKDQGYAAAELESRIDGLITTGKREGALFWPGMHGELEIKSDFVYLNTGDNFGAISQAEIFATVSNLLAAVRADNRGLTAPVRIGKEPVRWQQSVYGHALLDPANFEIYNDAILRAAFLRAASPAELQYFSDQQLSSRMLSIIRALVLGWGHGGGECLPEFLISLATKRLSLTAADMAALKSLLNTSSLPRYLTVLGDRI